MKWKAEKNRKHKCKWNFIKNISKPNKLVDQPIRTKRWNSLINNVRNGRDDITTDQEIQKEILYNLLIKLIREKMNKFLGIYKLTKFNQNVQI